MRTSFLGSGSRWGRMIECVEGVGADLVVFGSLQRGRPHRVDFLGEWEDVRS